MAASALSVVSLSLVAVLLVGVIFVIVRRVCCAAPSERLETRAQQLTVETLQAHEGRTAEELSRAGELNAAVVLRHRFTQPPATRRRRHHPPASREAMDSAKGGNNNSGSSSSSDIDPVALRQKPVEVEVTEEMRMVQECAVDGVVMRGDEVEQPAVHPRGGVIYRLPRSALTPTSVILSRSISPTSSGQQRPVAAALEESQTDISFRSFSRPVSPAYAREGGFPRGSSDAVVTTPNIDVHMQFPPSSRKGKVRNDSLIVYGHAAYIHEEHGDAMQHLIPQKSHCSSEAAPSPDDSDEPDAQPSHAAEISAQRHMVLPSLGVGPASHTDPSALGVIQGSHGSDINNTASSSSSSSSSSSRGAFSMRVSAVDVVGSVDNTGSYGAKDRGDGRVVFSGSLDWGGESLPIRWMDDMSRPPPIGASVATMVPGSGLSPGATSLPLQQAPCLPLTLNVGGGCSKDVSHSVDT